MSSGRGLMRGVPQFARWADVFALPDFTSYATRADVAADWYFAGRGPQTPVEIPWTWLAVPIRQWQDPPKNAAVVSTADGTTAYATDSDSIDDRGQWSFSASLSTATAADAQNLADWVVAYFSAPRTRLPDLRLKLGARSDNECRTILGREIGDRITITGAPTIWPAGGTALVIEGIAHDNRAGMREVVWSTVPVIGSTADQAGPWFRIGVSTLGGSDVVPF